jgi:hypothetical protein
VNQTKKTRLKKEAVDALKLLFQQGRARVQAVSRRLPMALGLVFSEYLGFSCQFSFYQILHTHLSSEAGTTAQTVTDVPSGLSLTPPQEKKSSETMKKDKPVFVSGSSWILGHPE